MLVISYEGWFQARFAQDPDPPNDPRGISGPTVAVAGEPDFDGVIRLQEPVCPRYPRDEDFGVDVTGVALRDPGDPDRGPVPLDDHPLVGARVRFLPFEYGADCPGGPRTEYPKFHQRNYIVVEGLRSPIDPLYFEIASGDVALRRRFLWDITRPCATILDVFTDPDLYGHQKQTIEVQSATAAEATGILDYEGYRQRRKAELEELLGRETDPIRRLALQKRIDGIAKDAIMTGTTLGAQQFLGMLSTYTMDLNGPPTVEDPKGRLAGEVGRSQTWPLQFWMGAYDVDTLCGYMKGTLSVPFRPARAG